MSTVVLLMALFLVTPTDAQVRPDNYYEVFNTPGQPEHTMTRYKGFGSKCNVGGRITVVKNGVLTDAEKESFLKSHNDYRRKVAKGLETRGKTGAQLPAADMMELTWDDELAAFAQRWAEQCPGDGVPHDENRRNDRWYWVGQNYFSDSDQSIPTLDANDPPLIANSEKAMELWTSEAALFYKEKINPFEYVSGAGHYTQIIWGNVEKLGCGFFMTKETRNRSYGNLYIWNRFIVCNYGPGGNINGGVMYTVGAAASKCPSGTVANHGLCRTDRISSNITGTSPAVITLIGATDTSSGATDIGVHVSVIIISLSLLV